MSKQQQHLAMPSQWVSEIFKLQIQVHFTDASNDLKSGVPLDNKRSEEPARWISLETDLLWNKESEEMLQENDLVLPHLRDALTR